VSTRPRASSMHGDEQGADLANDAGRRTETSAYPAVLHPDVRAFGIPTATCSIGCSEQIERQEHNGETRKRYPPKLGSDEGPVMGIEPEGQDRECQAKAHSHPLALRQPPRNQRKADTARAPKPDGPVVYRQPKPGPAEHPGVSFKMPMNQQPHHHGVRLQGVDGVPDVRNLRVQARARLA
jgi:hypothetical protein